MFWSVINYDGIHVGDIVSYNNCLGSVEEIFIISTGIELRIKLNSGGVHVLCKADRVSK